MPIENKLIKQVENLKDDFVLTAEKMIKDLQRQQLIMERSDKRQRQEYDELQQKLKEVQELQDEIVDTQREVVFTLGAIGECRSEETGNHVRRVAEYSKQIALHYGLKEEEADKLKQASPMHDIGKIAIPDEILNKPSVFNESDFEIMRTHAQIGYEMLRYSKRPLLQCAAIVAYQHHEKWNGNGYPQGLKGNEIHIYGRITAIADVFDALSMERCYKEAWDDNRIFDYFKNQRGQHFDPDLVDIFFEHIDELLEIRSSLMDR